MTAAQIRKVDSMQNTPICRLVRRQDKRCQFFPRIEYDFPSISVIAVVFVIPHDRNFIIIIVIMAELRARSQNAKLHYFFEFKGEVVWSFVPGGGAVACKSLRPIFDGIFRCVCVLLSHVWCACEAGNEGQITQTKLFKAFDRFKSGFARQRYV